MTIAFTVNGKRRKIDAHPMKRLLDVLREDCGLTGTKEGCGEGECGACTVLVDGIAVDSCLVPLAQVDGARLTTIEGVGQSREGRALQDAFVELGGAQCGICTPGMIVAALPIDANPSLDVVQNALAGNLCRCTGYVSIFRAVKRAKRKAPGKRGRARAT
jgi:aerobic carbon-monoxide dehydrogenase small subunit